MRDARDAIRAGTLDAWSRDWLARYHSRPVTYRMTTLDLPLALAVVQARRRRRSLRRR